jgi:tRNA threonylcarbamoyladenosine biosynthesis protein TsaE
MGMKVKFNKKEIPKISQKLLNKISKGKHHSAKILTFSGELGSGKTTFAQEIGKLLGVGRNIVSPTFVIMKIYEVGKNSKYRKKFNRLIHIDAYRLGSYLELLEIGWEKLVEDKNNLIILEWPERVNGYLGENVYNIKLNHVDGQTRSIEF